MLYFKYVFIKKRKIKITFGDKYPSLICTLKLTA